MGQNTSRRKYGKRLEIHMDTTTFYSLPEPLLNGLLACLGTCPYQEVMQLIDTIQKNITKLESTE